MELLQPKIYELHMICQKKGERKRGARNPPSFFSLNYKKVQACKSMRGEFGLDFRTVGGKPLVKSAADFNAVKYTVKRCTTFFNCCVARSAIICLACCLLVEIKLFHKKQEKNQRKHTLKEKYIKRDLIAFRCYF